MASNADRFPWCSDKEEEDERTRAWDLMDRGSILFGYARVNLSPLCGDGNDVYLGGVMSPRMGVAAHNADAFEPLYTTYWDLRVTTTTKTCPTFAASFANAFAYAAQIEIIITLVLIFVFKKVRMISDVQGVIDIGAAGIITAEKAAELSSRSSFRDAGKDGMAEAVV